LDCSNNQLTTLNMKNGNNRYVNIYTFNASSNPKLTCIQVDDVTYSKKNWTSIDETTRFCR
jgi:hypothetical protein